MSDVPPDPVPDPPPGDVPPIPGPAPEPLPGGVPPVPGDVPPDPEVVPDDPGGLLDRMRGTGVGVEDETIVGDTGPVDTVEARGAERTEPGVVPIVEGDDPGQV